MADPTHQKVLCIDPCDPQGTKQRYVSLLIQPVKHFRGAKASPSVELGWKPEPTLINPVRMIDQIDENTIIRKIHVIDPKFGNQIVHYITPKDTANETHQIANMYINTDKTAIQALWPHAVRSPEYIPGQGRTTPTLYADLYKDGEVYMNGTRSEFAATFITKYQVKEEVLADNVPTYCDCQLKGDNGKEMIQCSNGEQYCLNEWYHLECISMTKEDVPPEDWYCKECVEGKLGNLKRINYVPRQPANQKEEEAEGVPRRKPWEEGG
jgi:hypothetical protein